MSEFGKQIIFRQLLERHQRIQIPIIQRDYAQGRVEVEEVREEFLKALYNALSLPADHVSLPLNLDFIYGSVEGDNDTRFLPLDGQQRLTTLFLLHWYLAWQDNCLDEFQTMLSLQEKSRFTYHVRPSSEEFFNALVNFIPDLPVENVDSVSELITDQSWYFRYWRLDPTIQSSLTMINSIHMHFSGSEGMFSRLIDVEQPVIAFQLLDLENFGLSDDLYIKMNARGKPLTAFETFKARYEQEIEQVFSGETRSIAGKEFSVSEYFALRMDTQWADFFWEHRDKKSNLFDDAVMNLFRAVALVTRNPKAKTYIKDITVLRNKLKKTSFSFLNEPGWLDREFSELLLLLLDVWSCGSKGLSCQLPDSLYYDEIALFDKVVKESASLSSVELVQFSAYVLFVREHEDNIDSQHFQEWMRIVHNLSVNTSYERPADVQRSIIGLHKLIQYSNDVLKHFSISEKPVTGFSRQQIVEERLKAELIQTNNYWGDLIEQAETHDYFDGQIEFILEFCGVIDKWENTNCDEWEDIDHNKLMEQFKIYFEKSTIMFGARGLNGVGKYLWERALLTIDDYTISSGPNYSFLVNSSTEPASWKRLLRDPGDKRQCLKKLWELLEADEPIEEQLNIIVSNATELETWRKLFVQTPVAIEYCKKRAYRWSNENKIYLMSKSQMNGMHAELFTYCLYNNSIKKQVDDNSLLPFNLCSYQDINVTDIEPCISLRCSCDDYYLKFTIINNGNQFLIRIERRLIESYAVIFDLLNDDLGYHNNDYSLYKNVDYENLTNALIDLSQGLSKVVYDKEADA